MTDNHSYRIFTNRIYLENIMGRVKSFIIFLLALAPISILAQYSNDWVNFSQPYFKVPVSRDGVYRLRYSDLQASGFPVNSDPRFIQLFHRGKEQAIYIKGQADAVFNASDYLEFYGQKNDGTVDSLLYRPYSFQPHKYYNLYSDTSAYFLTYNSSLSRGLRMDSVQFVNVNNLPSESFQYAQRLLVLHDQYSAGLTLADVSESTYFDQGEGWTGLAIRQGQNIDYTIDSVYNGVTAGGNPKLELLLVGRDAIIHSFQVLVGPNAGALRVLASPSFNNFETFLVSKDLAWSDVGTDGKILVRLVAQTETTNRYQISASYIKLTFPQNFDLTGLKKKRLQLAVNPVGQSYVVFSNPPSNLKLLDITNLQSVTRILPVSSGSTFFVIVPATSVSKTLLASNQFIIPSIIPVTFRKVDPSSVNYIIITNRSLMKPGLTYSNPVKAFAAYRASTAGGSYDTLTITVDQLYNQFNYGETSPQAIYSFMKYMVLQGNIKYLFLIGKGRDIDYSPYRRLPLAPSEFPDLVPSAGYPGGDIAYTSGLKGTTYEPAVPTGRLTSTTPAEVASYFNKVKELESQSLEPWAKELLHLSGGGGNHPEDAFEIPYFRSIVDGFKKIAEGPYLGGHVVTKSKTSVGLEQINVSTIVNQGVNLITFFGHSDSYGTDIDIGKVDDPTLGYNNTGKYPVILINGCNAGTIFSNQTTFGENWMLTANKGSRNFIASTTFGYSNLLQKYSDLFYQVGFGDSTFIKKGIGDIQKESSRQYLSISSPTLNNIAQVQQMVLAGDPALKLFGTALPDYSINNGSLSLVSLDGNQVTSLSDSFAIKIIVKNVGAYPPRSMRIRLVRTFNDNSSLTYDSVYSSVSYIDTLTFKVLKGNKNGFGNNLFTIVIDPLNVITEISKTNNAATLNTFIPSKGTINLFPIGFGIVGTSSVNLVFQDADLLGAQRNFLVQIDTTDAFNSPFTIKRTVAGKVLAKTPLTLLSKDSVVYYWRTKPAKQNTTDSANWTLSSFVYINNSPEGWAQTKFPQINTNSLTGLAPDLTRKKIDYIETVAPVSVKSIGGSSPSPFTDASIKIKGVEYNTPVHFPCRNNTINLVAFDNTTAAPYPGLNLFGIDLRGCGLEPSVINSFSSTEVESADGKNMLQYVDNIHPSDSVVLYSVGDPTFSSWSSNVLTKLNDLGISSTQISSLQDGEPVVIFAKKGAAVGSAKIYRSSNSPVTSQDVAVSSSITGRYSRGIIKSALIGPAKKWVKFEAAAKEVKPTDKLNYSIYGVALSGQETLIQSNITSLDLSFINPVQYPQLKVELVLEDTVNLSAAQLKHWFVFYESVAEGLLFFEGPLTTQTVQEGVAFTAHYGFTNLSSKSFTDSLQVSAETVTIAKASHQVSTYKIKAPVPGDTTKFSFVIPTQGKAGLNDVNLFVNPKIQPEQYYENNAIYLTGYLNVVPDLSPPSLDVTVDGRYLQNDDFVSASPTIRVKLHDNNPFLFISDTTHLTILLSYPCSAAPCPFKRINFSRSDLHWTSATANSDFEVNFNPVSLPEGAYTLQVNGSDETGNASGPEPYSVDFQIKNETTIALRSVYPNPSRDIFNFGFVLSGNVLPDDFSLQIYTSDGRLLQQFGINDVSHFIIGINDLPWNASQESQSALFIYRLTVRASGKTTSQHGKLVLMK